jgi:hypothetical protein
MTIVSRGVLALCAATLAASAAAQDEPRSYVSTDRILYADLGRGGGAFTGALDEASNRFCYMLNVYKGDTPTAAHIHVGGRGETGRPVVPLETPANGAAGACVTLEPAVAQALAANPGGNYVNVHTAAHPAGLLRGQLRG